MEANFQLLALLDQCDIRYGFAKVNLVNKVAEVAKLARILASSDGNNSSGIKFEDFEVKEAYKKLLGDGALKCE